MKFEPRYRQAGAEVIETLMGMGLKCCVERASIDEAYIDLTEEVEERLRNGFKSDPSFMKNTIVAEYTGQSDEVVDDECEKQDEMTMNNLPPSSTNLESTEKSSNSQLLNSWIQNHCDLYNTRLTIGACVVEEMRAAVFRNTSFRCSAGVSHNKVGFHTLCDIIIWVFINVLL